MKKVWILLLMGLFLVGCGTANKTAQSNSDGEGIVAGEMVAILKEDSPLVFQYEVKNQTEKEVPFRVYQFPEV